MHSIARILFCLALLVTLGTAASSRINAGPLFFSNVQIVAHTADPSGTIIGQPIDLFSNPGVALFGGNLGLNYKISGSVPSDVFALPVTITFNSTDISNPFTRSIIFPIFSGASLPIQFMDTYVIPEISKGFIGTVTFDIGESAPDYIIPSGPQAGQGVDSYTFPFSFNHQDSRSPVPEPTALLLLGSGLAGISTTVRRRRKR